MNVWVPTLLIVSIILMVAGVLVFAVGRRRKRGRTGGKRNNPNYVETTTFITKKIYTRVDKELEQLKKGGKQQDFSELVESLLTDWLKSRK